MVEAKRQKHKQRQLRVVLDTNALYTDSESYLVRLEIAELIKKSVYADLEILWYLPEVVLHERQYQMQTRALELLPAVQKLEKLLGRGLGVERETLIEGVKKVVAQRVVDLNLRGISLNYSQVNWHEVLLDAVYRNAPFKVGPEKGFRDRLVVECFLQLVDESPKTPTVCRVVLVSGDGRVAEAVKSRTADQKHVEVFENVDALKGLINTLVSEVDETFLALLKPKALSLFWILDDETTLFYKNDVQGALNKKFAQELASLPLGATKRTNGVWHLSVPNFVSKSGQRVQWATRIDIDVEASKTATPVPPFIHNNSAEGKIASVASLGVVEPEFSNILSTYYSSGSKLKDLGATSLSDLGIAQWMPTTALNVASQVIKTHRGQDTYEVLWSADVTTKRELRRGEIDEIRHVETTWEQTA